MKKTFFALYALGALVVSPVLTSCVDDTESQSVTDVREAKAEQLKNIATLNNAKAQAETVAANAEAALKAAEAEYAKAQAAYQQALAEYQQAQTEYTLQQIESAKAALEYQKEQYAISLAQQQAYLDEQLSYLQVTLAQNEVALANSDDSKTNALVVTYTNALNDLVALKNSLGSAKINLASLEAGVTSVETLKANNIAAWEEEIAAAQVQLDYLTNTEYTSKTLNELWEEYSAKQEELNKANYARNQNEGVAVINARNVLIDALEELSNININSPGVSGLNGDYSEVTYVITFYNKSINLYDLNGNYINYYYVTTNFELNNQAKVWFDYYYAEMVNKYKNALGTEEDEEEGTAYGDLAVAKKQLAEANEMPEETDDEKTEKYYAIKKANLAIGKAQDALNDAQDYYDYFVERKENYEATLAKLDDLQKAIDAFETAQKAYDEAKETYDEAYPTELSREISALYELYVLTTTYGDVDSEIANLQSQIEMYQGFIDSYDDSVENAEHAVEAQKAWIAELEEEIAIQEIIVATAKAELEAAIGSWNATEE